MNRTRKWLAISFFFLSPFVNGQPQAEENITTSPAEYLRSGANAIITDYVVEFQIQAENRALYKVRKVVNILNPAGKEEAKEYIFYDRLMKVNDIKAASYDQAGKLIKRLKSSEISDQSAVSGFSLFDDDRVKVVDLAHGQYPYTVEFEYEVEFRFLFYIPTFFPVSSPNVALAKASYLITFEPENTPRYLERNINRDSVEFFGWARGLSWKFKSAPPIKMEKNGPPFAEYAPSIMSAPTSFEYEGYRGDMTTWENFGQWINSLNKGRDELSPETKSRLVAMTSQLKSDKEKVKFLYKYLQDKTRYVSVQLGIGGYQPIPAKIVDEVGYGDCKALSNYMIALLKAVGIEGSYVLIRAGANAPPIDLSFPSTQFNHVIVSVPLQGDTLWLECTSQKIPFNYLGTFTDDRNALSVSQSEVKVIRTPSYYGRSGKERNASILIEDSGKAAIASSTRYYGLDSEFDNLDLISQGSSEDQRKWIEAHTGLNSFHIEKFEMLSAHEETPETIVNVNYTSDHLATSSGKRLFVTPNLFNKLPFIFSAGADRKSKVFVKQQIMELDSIVITVPANYHVESLPDDRVIETEFGRYEIIFRETEGKLVYRRKLTIFKGTYSASAYVALNNFNKEISRLDNLKIALVNKT